MVSLRSGPYEIRTIFISQAVARDHLRRSAKVEIGHWRTVISRTIACRSQPRCSIADQRPHRILTTLAVPEQGKLRRALAAVWAFLQSLESTSFDYSLDRIERLEREVGRLNEEMRQSRDPGTVDAHNASAATREQ